MGCGKSTIANKLSKSLYPVCRFGCKDEEKWIIYKFYFESGEIYFRKMEHEVLSNY
jgi:shikimate kinase